MPLLHFTDTLKLGRSIEKIWSSYPFPSAGGAHVSGTQPVSEYGVPAVLHVETEAVPL